MSLLNLLDPCRYSELLCFEKKDDASKDDALHWGAVILATTSTCLALSCLAYRHFFKKITLQDCINNPENISRLQRAAHGVHKVYLGQNFVIKLCGNTCDARTLRKELARAAIQNNHYLHLVVPKDMGKIGDEYLVEERLPINQSFVTAQIVYKNNRKVFTAAVKEFTNLLMRCSFTDIVYQNPLRRYEPPRPRYDNVCPYLLNGEGKLGLVDTEHFGKDAAGFRVEELKDIVTEIKYCNLQTATTLTHLFPLHLDDILQVMGKEGLRINDAEWQQLYIASIKQLTASFVNHLRIESS